MAYTVDITTTSGLMNRYLLAAIMVTIVAIMEAMGAVGIADCALGSFVAQHSIVLIRVHRVAKSPK